MNMDKAQKQIIDINMEENRRSEIRKIFDRTPMYNLSALEIDGRKIRVSKNHWVIDFASCNYLGLDLDPEMDDDVSSNIKKWGVHPSWCRLVASPEIYDELERKLAELIGTETTLILPTVTLISIGVIPALMGKSGVMFLDKSAHETMYEAGKIARDSGAELESYKQDDFATLEDLLIKHKNNPRKLIIVDGVYSMTGDYADLPKLVELAKKYDAMVYVDDAHGFGVVGEKPDERNPQGYKGNGVVKYYGMSYDNIIYVGGCSKAYSSLAAFIGCTNEMKKFLEAFATPYDLSGPCPTASLATMLKGLEINEKRGDEYREKLWKLTERAIDGIRKLGFTVINKTGFPIVSVVIGDTDKLIDTANILYEKGILVTVAPFPMVKRGEECHRITLTSANTEQEVDQLIGAFAEIKKYLEK
ncbi:MAG: 7-keto-8-aminopelargonate synthetase-like protein enzyme [Parcubacteria group bacterium GW2011_GWB1_40_14]|nr:MAG: 7-keto-8-aminopelargonate synthetase-like protein enzyme [Parcubacteria group bacterium GW2011_GWB1_40_14]